MCGLFCRLFGSRLFRRCLRLLLQVGRIHMREHLDQRSPGRIDRPCAERRHDQSRGESHEIVALLQTVPREQEACRDHHTQECQIAGPGVGEDHHHQMDDRCEYIENLNRPFLGQDHVHAQAQHHNRSRGCNVDVAPDHHRDAFPVVLQTQSGREGKEFHPVVLPHAPCAENGVDCHCEVDHSLEDPLRVLPAHQCHEGIEDEGRHGEHEQSVIVELEKRFCVQAAPHRAPQYIPQEHEDQHDLFKTAHPPDQSSDFSQLISVHARNYNNIKQRSEKNRRSEPLLMF